MKEIRTEILIKAASSEVWDFFNNFKNFQNGILLSTI